MLLWFRNDLRVHDNPALDQFLLKRRAQQGQGQADVGKAIFFVSKKQWHQHDWSAIKIDFIDRHVRLLAKQLSQLNIELQVVEAATFTDQIAYLQHYCQQQQISDIFANSEVELNEMRRDQRCLQLALPLRLFEADVIVPKGKVLSQTGQMFKVFTPFKRAWLNYVRQYGVDYIPRYPQISLASCQQEQDSEPTLSSAWPLVTLVEQQVLPQFLQQKLADYHRQRDFPTIKATSGLSPYLAIGAISPRYLLMLLRQACPDILTATDSEQFSWLNELIWREFYRHLLFHHPKLCQHQCFNEKYQHLLWPNDASLLTAWQQGKTGYPLVDAAMRQLVQTGWMHNRLRMVVASFLTKHLLVDWRQGEQFFMRHLIDGDLAANNGGWQWAASTGCDAQPYFRVFNPIRQSERFDPQGKFIRKYLPELNDVPDKYIHFPHQYLKKSGLTCYWPAIVNHKSAREQALAFFRQ